MAVQNAAQYRERAQKLRTQMTQMHSPYGRQLLADLADEYDLRASNAEYMQGFDDRRARDLLAARPKGTRD
jgi:hypothetical protein